MADIRTSELKEPIDVGEYLTRRLHEVGVRSVHGVPGDFNLRLLDYVGTAGLRWVGNANELNAGYAADGYARIKGISALITTFGVGELSAVNAVAGAFSEYVPLVHIVGTPSTISQRDGMLLHHTLGNGDFTVFRKMGQAIACATAALNDASTAAGLIDHAITECYIKSRPVYIALPTDIVEQKVEGARLKDKLDLSFKPNETEKEDYVVDVVLKYLYAAKNPVILVDACAIRHRALEEVTELIAKSGLPVFTTPMGKGAVDESIPTYGGVYAGDGSNAGVRERVEASDLVLSIGAIKSDFNTAGFTYRTQQLATIDFHSNYIRVRYSEYPGVRMNGVLRKVSKSLDVKKLSVQEGPNPTNEIPKEALTTNIKGDDNQTVTHDWLWPRLGQWLRKGDTVITETGTANFGIWNTRFPAEVQAISQVLWGSIGYATGSLQGAALAAKELGGPRRTILFTGDGSLQLTVQEISTMIRNELNPIIFVICNDGYTIERFIHGWDSAYNDIQTWDHTLLPKAFGAKDSQAATYQVKTRDEVDKLFADESFATSEKLRLVELYMPREDAPASLTMTAAAAAKTNERKK